jgi:hypothetical protein
MWSVLAADPGVQAIFGSPPRIYPEVIPQLAPMPAALYFLISGQLAGGFEATWAAEERISKSTYTPRADLAWNGMLAFASLENRTRCSARLSARCRVPTSRLQAGRTAIASFWQSR